MNEVLLAKLGWSFLKNDNSLWCKVLKGKNGSHGTSLSWKAPSWLLVFGKVLFLAAICCIKSELESWKWP